MKLNQLETVEFESVRGELSTKGQQGMYGHEWSRKVRRER